jgi:hypothetical protein
MQAFEFDKAIGLLFHLEMARNEGSALASATASVTFDDFSAVSPTARNPMVPRFSGSADMLLTAGKLQVNGDTRGGLAIADKSTGGTYRIQVVVDRYVGDAETLVWDNHTEVDEAGDFDAGLGFRFYRRFYVLRFGGFCGASVLILTRLERRVSIRLAFLFVGSPLPRFLRRTVNSSTRTESASRFRDQPSIRRAARSLSANGASA